MKIITVMLIALMPFALFAQYNHKDTVSVRVGKSKRDLMREMTINGLQSPRYKSTVIFVDESGIARGMEQIFFHLDGYTYSINIMYTLTCGNGIVTLITNDMDDTEYRHYNQGDDKNAYTEYRRKAQEARAKAYRDFIAQFKATLQK
jgi:hypothetical protein